MAFGDIAKLLASLDLDTKPFERSAGRVGGSLGKMESGMGRVSTRSLALGTAIGTSLDRIVSRGIGALFDNVRAGEESLRKLQDATAQTSAVIESTGGKAGVSAQQVRDLAEEIEGLTTADDKAVQQGENLLLTFTNIGGDVFPRATKAIVDLGIALNKGNAETADFDSAAIQLGKALNDPIKGITALRRVGVSFSADQEKQIKGWAAWGSAVDTAAKLGLKLNKEQTELITKTDGLVAPLIALRDAGVKLTKEQEKWIKENAKQNGLLLAQGAILDELETEFGKAGEAAGKSGASGVRRLHDAVEDAQLALAEGLASALEDIRSELAAGLSDPQTQKDIRNLGVFLGDAAKSGLAFAKSVPWGQIADGLKTAAGFAGNLIKAFANLPPGVQATIIGLVGLNKLAGGGVIKIGVDLFKEGVQGAFKALFQRGSSPANPLFVTGAGLGGVAGAAKGGLGAAGKLFLIGEAIGLVAAVNEVRDNIVSGLGEQAKTISTSLEQNLAQNPQTLESLKTQLAAVETGIRDITANPLNVLIAGDALKELEQMRTTLQTQITKVAANTSGSPDERDEKNRAAQQQAKLDKIRDGLESSRIAMMASQSAAAARITSANRSSTDRIVSAIHGINIRPPQVSVRVNADGTVSYRAPGAGWVRKG